MHGLPAFRHEQDLQRPLPLHRQQTGILVQLVQRRFADCPGKTGKASASVRLPTYKVGSATAWGKTGKASASVRLPTYKVPSPTAWGKTGKSSPSVRLPMQQRMSGGKLTGVGYLLGQAQSDKQPGVGLCALLQIRAKIRWGMLDERSVDRPPDCSVGTAL